MSLRTITVALCITGVGGCFIPDGYDPCHGFCPDAQVSDAGPPPDTGSLGGALGPTHEADPPPPALSGGTLLVSHTRPIAVLGDADTDTIRVIDTGAIAQVGVVALAAHDEPGRSVEDASGLVHVVLRGTGAIATIDLTDPDGPTITARRAVCPVPRGIAYDGSRDRLYVACLGGELVTLPPVGAIERTVRLASDLRDVVVMGDALLVTRFRSSELLVVDPIGGSVTRTITLPPASIDGAAFAPSVAWRAIAAPTGAFVLHQLAASTRTTTVPTCNGAVVQAAITPVADGMARAPLTLPCAPVAIDVALSPDARSIAIAVAGAPPLDPCHPILVRAMSGAIVGPPRSLDCLGPRGRVVALAWGADGTLFAQTRAPLTLFVVPPTGAPLDLQLPGTLVRDTGLDVFHAAGVDHVACASCHPEGGEDGRRWTSHGESHRTIGLRGGLLATAPFGWHGELATFDAVLSDMLWHPMDRAGLEGDQPGATARWIDAQPAWASPTVDDADAVVRGRTIFESACASCHAGPRFSDQSTRGVADAGAFRVPSLVGVAYRGPYFHDGCAATLDDVLRGCNALHDASTLSTGDQRDLSLFLASL